MFGSLLRAVLPRRLAPVVFDAEAEIVEGARFTIWIEEVESGYAVKYELVFAWWGLLGNATKPHVLTYPFFLHAHAFECMNFLAGCLCKGFSPARSWSEMRSLVTSRRFDIPF